MRKILALVFVACFKLINTAQIIHFVDATRVDNSGNGLSWATAKKGIQNAVDDCVAGDEVWIKAGTYTPNSYPSTYTIATGNAALSSRDFAIYVLKDNIKLYGGFSGTETAISQRIYAQNQTIIDGNIGSATTHTDNCYHVLVYVGQNSGSIGVTIDGINFRNGYASGSGNFDSGDMPPIVGYTSFDEYLGRNFGGGVYLTRGANSKINNCTFHNCYSYNRGGGTWFDGGFGNTYGTTITNCVYESNNSLNYGAGAGYNYGTNKVYNCVFTKNTSVSDGTALIFFQGDNTLANNTIAYNTSDYSSVLSAFNGGSIKVYNSIFWGNKRSNSTTVQGVDFFKPGTFYRQYSQFVTSVFKNNVMQLNAVQYDSTSNINQAYDLGVGSSGNIFKIDPLFRDSLDIDGADNIYGTSDDGLFLTGSSPAINTASNTLLPLTYSLDVTNSARIVNTTLDMGAYEFVCVTPSITSSPTSTSVCAGANISFSVGATGSVNKYQWYKNSSAISNATLAILNIGSLLSTDAGTYNVKAIGCVTVTSNSFSVTVSPAPTLSVSNGAVCSGQSFTISPTGANTYTYSGGSAIVSPTTTTSYSITGTSAQGCVSSNTAVISVTVNALPTVSVNSGTICSGSSFTIIPGGASTYSISGGLSAVTLTSNANYSVTGTSAQGCASSNTAVSSVTVNALPSVSVNSGAICSGNSFTLVPGGASTYSISGGASVVTPTSNATYSVTGTSAQGCVSSNTAVSLVTVNTTPTVAASGGTICSGQSFTISPTGANTYTYSSGSAIVGPTTTTSYSIAGTGAQGCVSSNTAVISVTVNALPTVSVNSGTICSGNSFTIIPGGASTYNISGGSSVVTPTSNTNFSVTGTSAAGCVSSNTAISSVTVNAIPSVSVNSGAICSGNSFTLVPVGANTYSISGGSSVVSPTSNTNYSVTGTSAQGCVSSNTAVSSVTVNALPTVSVNSGAVCAGNAFTLVPSGASSYTISGGSFVVTPTADASYTLTGTNTAGCVSSNTAVSTVTVNALPSITISVTNASVCAGYASTLTASGAFTYTWNTGSSAASIVSTPISATTFTVLGTSSFGCINSATQVIGLFPASSINVSSTSASVCAGSSATVTASGVSTYTWNTGATAANIVSTPSINTTYTVNGTDANGCNATNTISIGIGAVPVVGIVASSTSICSGNAATLTANGANSFVWNSGAITASVSLSPTVNTTYTVVGTNAAGCSASHTLSLIVYTTPTVSAGNDVTVNRGDRFTLNGNSNAATYTWSPATDLSNANSLMSNGTCLNTTTYTLVVTSVNGCVNSSSVVITVEDVDLKIANYVSPNGDGQNDTWKISNLYLIKDFAIEIVDQWGNKVFSVPGNYNNDWDGTKAGSKLPDGVYYYLISENGKTKYNGSITVLH